MNLFLDTSSLIKLYHKEEGSDKVMELALAAHKIYLSSLSILEFSSALWKKVRTQEITKDNCMTVIAIFEDDKYNYHWITQDFQINQSAYDLLKKWGESGLRTLDSIQLASAITLREQHSVVFSTADSKLRELFKQENLELD